MKLRWALVLAGGLVVAMSLPGCSGGNTSEVSPAKDKEIRNNFSRALTPEEQARMGGGPSKGATPQKGAPDKG